MATNVKMPEKLSFDYIKSNHFRVIHADGAWGGVTVGLDIFMGVFSTRPAIPTQMTHSVLGDGQLGPEIREERAGRSAVIREMEVGMTMDIATARSISKWLSEKADSLEQLFKDKEKVIDEPTHS